MALWDSVKKLATKAKCGVGFHGGTFSTPEGKPGCYFEKTCPDCMELIIKRHHEYPLTWENAKFDFSSHLRCMRTQQCIHCGDVEKREIHERYQKVGVNAHCQAVLSCERCGHEKLGDYEHSFTRDGTDNGMIVMKCMRCGARETRRYV